MAAELPDDRLISVPSKYANSMIAYKPTEADEYFIFRKSKSTTAQNGTKAESYRCRGCEQAKGDGFVSTTFFRDGRMVREPNADHKEGCRTLTRIELEAFKLRREMNIRCREGVEPRVAYEMVLAESTTAFDPSTESGQLLRQKIGSFQSLRQILCRNASKTRDEEYEHLSTRERRRRSAIAAARKRKAAQESSHQDSSYAVEEAMVLDGSNEESLWLQAEIPVIESPVRGQNNTPANVNEVRRSRLVSPDHGRNFSLEHDYNANGPRSTVAGSTGYSNFRISSSAGRNSSAPSSNTAAGNSRSRSAAEKRASYSANPGPLGNAASASVTDIVKVMEACRKKTRWECFGDFVAKTLESIPEEAAAKAAREVQEIIFRVQDELRAKEQSF